MLKITHQTPIEKKQYLTFMLEEEIYCLNILSVKEIIWYSQLSLVPMMPACIRGVINLRGAVVPVMDLTVRFGKPPALVTKSSCIIITEVASQVEGESQNIGVVVDAVQAVLEIPSSEIELPPAFGTRIRSDFIEGIAKVNSKFAILLNLNSVLSTDDIEAIDRAAAPVTLLTA